MTEARIPPPVHDPTEPALAAAIARIRGTGKPADPVPGSGECVNCHTPVNAGMLRCQKCWDQVVYRNRP